MLIKTAFHDLTFDGPDDAGHFSDEQVTRSRNGIRKRAHKKKNGPKPWGAGPVFIYRTVAYSI
jgi:hypothetical protein